MSEQQPQLPPVYAAEEPSKKSIRLNAFFDELETKQPDTLDDASKALIERVATFLGVLFGLTVLSNNFPPAYLKGDGHLAARVIVIVSLVCFFGSLVAAMGGTLVRPYRRYTYNVTEMDKEVKRMLKQKLYCLRVANILFALGAMALAVLLIVVVASL